MTEYRFSEIDAYVDREEFRAKLKNGDWRSRHAAYWEIVNQFGIDGVHWLDNFILSASESYKTKAAAAVVAEWRERQQLGQQTRAERRANLSIKIAIIALGWPIIWRIGSFILQAIDAATAA